MSRTIALPVRRCGGARRAGADLGRAGPHQPEGALGAGRSVKARLLAQVMGHLGKSDDAADAAEHQSALLRPLELRLELSATPTPPRRARGTTRRHVALTAATARARWPRIGGGLPYRRLGAALASASSSRGLLRLLSAMGRCPHPPRRRCSATAPWRRRLRRSTTRARRFPRRSGRTRVVISGSGDADAYVGGRSRGGPTCAPAFLRRAASSANAASSVPSPHAAARAGAPADGGGRGGSRFQAYLRAQGALKSLVDTLSAAASDKQIVDAMQTIRLLLWSNPANQRGFPR